MRLTKITFRDGSWIEIERRGGFRTIVACSGVPDDLIGCHIHGPLFIGHALRFTTGSRPDSDTPCSDYIARITDKPDEPPYFVGEGCVI